MLERVFLCFICMKGKRIFKSPNINFKKAVLLAVTSRIYTGPHLCLVFRGVPVVMAVLLLLLSSI